MKGAPSTCLPTDGGARIWTIDLDVERDTSSLSMDERDRRDSFHQKRDGERFAAGRAALRDILSWFVTCHPKDLSFVYGPHGKPSLRTDASSQQPIHFNVTHAGRLALIAVSRFPVGIDVEAVDSSFVGPSIVESNFADDEIAAWKGLPAELQVRSFFKVWTSREALVKATGRGLSTPRSEIAVCADPRTSPRILHGAKTYSAKTWRLECLPAPPNYLGVMAIAAHAGRTAPGDDAIPRHCPVS